MNYFYINNLKINNLHNNKSIIEYCENIGINIPHYCYHPNLSIAGNCRMCLIEVKNSPKPVIACSMSILNKMEIYTDSPLVKKARESVLEFLLLNHPLDCPVCDQGGECDLQDQSFVFGITKKRFYNYKRVVTDKNLGPIVKTVMTRCIHCTRCVRFSTEIAGTNSLGIFGRGQNSEIGTYISNVFNSELSGNVIDICPVGALTSKQYPFIGRSWELKKINTYDYSDSTLLDIDVYMKSNKLVKIMPSYSNNNYSNNWISDKTRLSFDGMFSPSRLNDLSIEINSNIISNNTWNSIFKNILLFTYFNEHLTKHTLNNFSLTIIFNDKLDLDSLHLLLLLSNKYPFICLRTDTVLNKNVDLENTFTINTFLNPKTLKNSNLCLLFNTNPRYENINLNIKLRQRILKGNFQIFSINSSQDLTYPNKILGSNSNKFINILEGTDLFCQNLYYSKNPIFIFNSQFYKRKDRNLLTYFTNSFQTKENKIVNLNVLNSSVNETGLNIIQSFNSFSKKDLNNSSSIIYINSSESNKLNNLLELYSLNFFSNEIKYDSILNLNYNKNSLLKFKKFTNVYFNLPTKVFFEFSGNYVNNNGLLKKSLKLISSSTKSKETWQIIRKTITSLDKINFIFNDFNNITYNIDNLKNFNKFFNFNYYPVNNMNGSSTYFKNKLLKYNFNKTSNKIKLYQTKLLNWLDDFYINGNDNYSKFSLVMIQCSKSFRMKSTNFFYL